MGEPNHKIVISVDVVVHILLKGWDETNKSLMNRTEMKDLKQESINQAFIEFLIFYLYYFGIELGQIFSEEQFNIMINAIQVGTLPQLGLRDEQFINENAERLNLNTAGKIEYVQKHGLLIKFSDTVEKRLAEYYEYKYLTSLEKNGVPIEESKNNAHAAFYQRVAKIVKGDSEDSFRMIPMMLAYRQIQKYERELESKGISRRARYQDAKIINNTREAFDQ